MNWLRSPAAVIAVTTILVAAAALGACNGPTITLSDCTTPLQGELAADGGPDPCHCDPPPSLNVTTCACLSGTAQEVSQYQACMAVYHDEQAADGGPISGCTGQCWPAPPDYWASPQLLWFGSQIDVPPCPDVAPIVAFDGYAGSLFALACASTASGRCPGLEDICAPREADGFSQCVVRAGDVDCPLLAPYIEKHVFYETVDGQPTLPSTFCCLASPTPAP